MYETFFGLSDLPFRLTPDPKYLFMSAKHREAFAHLVYGISEGSGFVAITGEVGAGKTTLIRALLAEHATDVTVVSIVNPVLTSTELLQTINAELGLPSRSTSRKELLEELAAFLKDNKASGRRTVIIVDEAQNLDPVVLEQLRLLSNLETETEKLLQVVLVGQPELHGLLQRHDLRQLNQRVTERWHLDKLDRDEAFEYLRHRLRVAGAKTDLLDPKALELIFRFTGGVPRLLNILANRALLVAFTRSRGRAGADEVTSAARELGYVPQVAAAVGGGWGRALAGVAAMAAAAVVAFLLLSPLGEEEKIAAKPSAPAPLPGAGPAAPEPAPVAVEAVPAAVAPVAPQPEPAPAAPVAVPTPPPVAVSEAAVPVAAPVEDVAATDAATLASLATGSVFDAAVADFSRLLQAWGAAPVTDADLASESLNLAEISESRGLRYFSAELNDVLLEVLDLPALLEMHLPGSADTRFVLLASMDRAAGRIRLGSGDKLSLSALQGVWRGKAHLLFKDPEGLRYDLAPGSGGPAVRKLQSMLSGVGVLEGPPTGLYDDLTEIAVRRFQEEHEVNVDGVTGPITQILLYNSLARFARPTLAQERGDPAAPTQGPT